MNNHEKNAIDLIEIYYSDQTDKEIDYLLGRDEKAIKMAADFFQVDEIPESVTEASFLYDRPKLSRGYLWATNKRIFFAGTKDEGFLKSPQPFYKEFSYGSIATIQVEEAGLFSSTKIILHILTNSANGNVVKVEFSVSRAEEKWVDFVDFVEEKIDDTTISANDSPVNSIETDFITQLERLGRLKSQGVITETEFLVAKKKLLNS